MHRYYRSIRYLMGSPIEITAYGEEAACSKGIDAAFREMARIERLLSVYRPESALARLNRFLKRGILRLDHEVLEILSHAIRYAEASGGAFDPTAGPVIDLWGFGPGGEKEVPPSREAIVSTLQSVGYRYLKVSLEAGEVQLFQEGMSLNLGGVAKGYAIDRAIHALKVQGITRGLVSCGSTLYGLGSPPGTSGWRIVIRHPRREEGKIASVVLYNQALATSGDYERCFFYNGRRFSHLIDPRTGYPTAGMASVSVIAPSAMAADALSTAAFVSGAEGGIRLLEGLPAVAGLIVPENPEGGLTIHTTGKWELFLASPSMGRRRFLAMIVAAFIGLVLPAGAAGVTIRFATEKEAFQRLMPDADRFDVEKVVLSSEQLAQAQQLAGKRFRKKNYRFWTGWKGDAPVGYGVILNVIGKKRPITFLIGIDPGGRVMGMEVLIYRESEGSEIRFPQFMKQFLKKDKESPLRLGRDIRPISGATLSSRSATYAVRKALSLFEAVYKEGR